MGVRRVIPDLSSTSLEAAKGFYGDLLGLRPVMDHGRIVTLADPERPGAQISLMTHNATAPVIPDVVGSACEWLICAQTGEFQPILERCSGSGRVHRNSSVMPAHTGTSPAAGHNALFDGQPRRPGLRPKLPIN